MFVVKVVDEERNKRSMMGRMLRDMCRAGYLGSLLLLHHAQTIAQLAKLVGHARGNTRDVHGDGQQGCSRRRRRTVRDSHTVWVSSLHVRPTELVAQKYFRAVGALGRYRQAQAYTRCCSSCRCTGENRTRLKCGEKCTNIFWITLCEIET